MSHCATVSKKHSLKKKRSRTKISSIQRYDVFFFVILMPDSKQIIRCSVNSDGYRVHFPRDRALSFSTQKLRYPTCEKSFPPSGCAQFRAKLANAVGGVRNATDLASLPKRERLPDVSAGKTLMSTRPRTVRNSA